MNLPSIRKLLYVFLFIISVSVFTEASDRALLETLVKKGYLTEEEAKNLEDSSTRSDIKSKHLTAKNYPITLSGSIHTQMDMLRSKPAGRASLPEEKNFFVRRASFTLTAPFNEDWGAVLSPDLASKTGSGTTSSDTAGIGAAFIYWNYAKELNFTFGYDGAPFGFENNKSSSKIKTVERSVMTNYFAGQLDHGGGRTGIHVQGDLSDHLEGVYYEASVTSAADNVSRSAADSGNTTGTFPAVWGRLGYKNVTQKGMNYDLGLDVGHVRRQRVTINKSSSRDTVMALHGEFSYQKLYLLTELMSGYMNKAKFDGSRAKPRGFVIQPSYKFNDKWEGVLAYSWVSSDGATSSTTKDSPGLNPSTVVRRAPAVKDASAAPFRYKQANNLYVGASYYIKGNDVKLTAGYEHAQVRKAYSPLAPKKMQINGIRARLQLCF
jgi:hypothetical protein